LAGRNHATIDDVRALVHPVLRHRILIGYRAEAEGVSVEQVIDRLLEAVPSPIGS
jgi:MoxR-like ATPase